jgi:hypothetical protein
MKLSPALKWLVPLIFVLTLGATLAGLWPGTGQPYPLTNFRGEQITINAQGLYYWDTVSSAAQMQANDLVTLVLGLPLLVIAAWLSWRGSLRGRLLLSGTLAFILYTYITMSFGAAYNKLFLVYVALFSLSLFAFILSVMSYDLKTFPAHFSDRLPRRGIAAMLFFAATFLLLAWLGRILPMIFTSQIPALENVTSMFIQVMDLGIIIPVCFLSGILLLRRSPWGYLLASISMMKFITLGLAVSLMGINMARVGVPASPVEIGAFLTITLINLALSVVLLKNIKE